MHVFYTTSTRWSITLCTISSRFSGTHTSPQSILHSQGTFPSPRFSKLDIYIRTMTASEQKNWPSSGGREYQGTLLTGSGGALASLPHAKIYPTSNQGPDDGRIWRRPQGSRGRDTETQKDLCQENLPGADRDLGAVQGL